MTPETERITALILQRRRQFLVHSFLFYELDESIVPDSDFDRWARELIELQRKHPDIAARLPFHDLLKRLDTSISAEAMGITRKDYPEGIVTVAVFLLHRHKGKRTTFRKFAQMYGYKVTDSLERGEA